MVKIGKLILKFIWKHKETIIVKNFEKHCWRTDTIWFPISDHLQLVIQHKFWVSGKSKNYETSIRKSLWLWIQRFLIWHQKNHTKIKKDSKSHLIKFKHFCSPRNIIGNWKEYCEKICTNCVDFNIAMTILIDVIDNVHFKNPMF